MKKFLLFFKKEPMLPAALIAAAVSLFITPPTETLLTAIDWRTLGTLFMMLTVLEGFKQENVFRPLLRLTGKIGTMAGLSLFLVFGVFFSSMFVTNDVSLIVFVPITILLFRAANQEKYILPVKDGYRLHLLLTSAARTAAGVLPVSPRYASARQGEGGGWES